MQDFKGNELAIGDKVLYTNRNLYELHEGTIHKISKSRVIIELKPPQHFSSNLPDGTVYKWTSKDEHIITSSDQILKYG